MLHRTGLWRLTRNRYGRRLWDVLSGMGVKATRMHLYASHTTGRGAESRTPPAGVEFALYDGTPPDPPASMDPAELSAGDAVVAATLDGEVAGYCYLSHDRPVRLGPLDRTVVVDGAYLWRLFVEPAHRQRGIATGLVDAALGLAGDRLGVGRVFALVAADNVPSQQVFEGNGFARVATASYWRVFDRSRRRWRTPDGEDLGGLPAGVAPVDPVGTAPAHRGAVGDADD